MPPKTIALQPIPAHVEPETDVEGAPYAPVILEPGTNKEQRLWFADGLDVLEAQMPRSVDMVFCDLPYGTTQNKWDTVIDLDRLWDLLGRVVKKNGAMVFTAAQPFTGRLVMSRPQWFKYEIIWEKTLGSGQLNIKHQPLRVHESCLVFYRAVPLYHEQLLPGEPYAINRGAEYAEETYGVQRAHRKVNTGFRHARSILKVSNPRVKGGHPTQKPVDLMRWFIRTFTDPGHLVLDLCMGAGSTGEAAWLEDRKFLGMERKFRYFDMATRRLTALPQKHADNINPAEPR